MAQAGQYLCFEAKLVHHDFVVDFVTEDGLDHHASVAINGPEDLSVSAVWSLPGEIVRWWLGEVCEVCELSESARDEGAWK